MTDKVQARGAWPQAGSQAGFTLIELAIALTVVGIMASGALISLSQYIKSQRVIQTKANIELVENSLSAYVQTHDRLPCPADGTTAGVQQPATGNCFLNGSNASLYYSTEGIIPWKELGIPQSVALDAWGRYITYKPAPQLTLQNLSVQQQDALVPTDPNNDVHNACRTAMWYDPFTGNHINRGKALFCCNAAPKAASIGGTVPSALQAGWQQNGIVDSDTAAGLGAIAGNSLTAGTTVAATGNWMDPSTTAAAHGSFAAFNGTKPEPPLLRATGLAVTLISHGGDGALAFQPEQPKTALNGGATLAVGGGLTNTGITPVVEQDNIWPANIFAGVFGHPKNAGTFDALNPRPGVSNDLVAYLRSDDLYGKVGNASCELPPGGTFQPQQTCRPETLSQTAQTFYNPATSKGITMSAISGALQKNQGIPFVLKTQASRLTDDAGYNNSLGVYTIAPDGTIQNVTMLQQNMHSLNIGQSATVNQNLTGNVQAIGTFILPDGNDYNSGYANLDMTSLQLVYDFGKPDQRAANLTTDTGTASANISLIAKNTSTGAYQVLTDAATNNEVVNQYSPLNSDLVNHDWTDNNHAAKSVVTYEGVNTDPTKGPINPYYMQAGYEDLSSINCYLTNDGSCVASPPALGAGAKNALVDQYGVREANIGDNDYDDVAVGMSVTQCAPSN